MLIFHKLTLQYVYFLSTKYLNVTKKTKGAKGLYGELLQIVINVVLCLFHIEKRNKARVKMQFCFLHFNKICKFIFFIY